MDRTAHKAELERVMMGDPARSGPRLAGKGPKGYCRGVLSGVRRVTIAPRTQPPPLQTNEEQVCVH